MAFIRRPNHWLCFAAFAAAFWITLRVMAAPAAVARPTPEATVDLAADLAALSPEEIRDPALERLIARFAREAAQSELRRNPR